MQTPEYFKTSKLHTGRLMGIPPSTADLNEQFPPHPCQEMFPLSTCQVSTDPYFTHPWILSEHPANIVQ